MVAIKGMIENKMDKEDILAIVNNDFLSPKAPFIGI